MYDHFMLAGNQDRPKKTMRSKFGRIKTIGLFALEYLQLSKEYVVLSSCFTFDLMISLASNENNHRIFKSPKFIQILVHTLPSSILKYLRLYYGPQVSN